MEIFIAHIFTEYPDNDERYAYSSAHKSRAEAVEAVNADMVSALDVAGIDDDEDTTAEKEIAAAWARGDLTEGHDAILEYGDMVKYCNISPATL